jgi:hypothetical protein
MSKCYVAWSVNEQGQHIWTCKKFGAGINTQFPENIDKCYYAPCPGRGDRPLPRVITLPQEITPPQQPSSVSTCAWFRCSNPVAANKLRHCSEVCRKRQNRYDYKQRKKAESCALRAK